MVRKTQENALVTRERILDAAVVQFGEHGVSRTTLADIAREAGVTRGAIYWHFKDKVDLFAAMIERLVERLVIPLFFRNENQETWITENPLGFVRDGMNEFFEKLAHDENFLQVFEILWHKCEYVGDIAELRRKCLEEDADHIGVLQRAFVLAKERGQISANPREAAIGLVSLINGLIFNWTKNRSLFSMPEEALSIMEIFFRGLGANPKTINRAGEEGTAYA